MPNTMSPPTSVGSQARRSVTLTPPAAVAPTSASMAASVTATPPTRGTETVWILRPPGRSTSPHRRANTRTTGVSAAASSAARTSRAR